MPDARETILEAGADPIFQREMAALNTHPYPVTE
jgi:hypothetical protein